MKARANKLNKPEDGNFGKTWNYICDQHSIKECFAPGFFNTIGGNLMAGDQIRMIRMYSDKRVAGLCDGIVLEVKDSKHGWEVEFRPLQTDIVDFGPPKHEPRETPKAEGPEYIKGEGRVEWNFGKKSYTVFEDGKEVYQTSKKAEANAVARGDQPIPVAV